MSMYGNLALCICFDFNTRCIIIFIVCQVPCAEFQLTSISELRNTILLVTQHRLTRSKIIGVKGGTVTSESDERAKIYVPPNAFSRDKKIELKVNSKLQFPINVHIKLFN